MRGLRKALTTDFYSAQADGGNGMVGLRAICAETGTVGEIEKRKYSWYPLSCQLKIIPDNWNF